jgi:hypothetical protein
MRDYNMYNFCNFARAPRLDAFTNACSALAQIGPADSAFHAHDGSVARMQAFGKTQAA